MSKYDRDPRVSRSGQGYTVTKDGHGYRVLHSRSLGWCIYTGQKMQMVIGVDGRGRGGSAVGYRNPDDAIKALIGRPKR